MTNACEEGGTQVENEEEDSKVEATTGNPDKQKKGISDKAKLKNSVKNLEKSKDKKGKKDGVMPKSKGILKNKERGSKDNYKTQAKDTSGKKIYPGKIHDDHEDKKPKSWAVQPITEKKDKKKKKGVKFDVPKAFSCSVSNVVQLESTIDQGNPFISCDGGCKLQALKKCLGTNYEIDVISNTFTCLCCSRKSEKKSTKCLVCCREDVGLFTKVADEEEKFIHFTCGLLCDNFEIKDLKTMEFH